MTRQKKKLLIGISLLVLAVVFLLVTYFLVFRPGGQVNGIGEQSGVGVFGMVGMITYDPGSSSMASGEQRTIIVKANIGNYAVDGFQIFADLSGAIPAGLTFSVNDLTAIGLANTTGDLIDYNGGKRMRILFVTINPQVPTQFSQDIILGTLSFTVPSSGQMQITTNTGLTKILENASGSNIAQIPGVQQYTFQSPGTGTQPTHLKADYDGDSKTDIGIFNPLRAEWYITRSGLPTDQAFFYKQFGWQGTQPLLGDYDGDGKTDIGVFDPIGAGWYMLRSGSAANSAFFYQQFGWSGTVPLQRGDYDGDGKADIGIFNPVKAEWYMLRSGLPANQAFYYQQFGWQGVTPLMGGDYDGDGKTDIGIFNPIKSEWYVTRSGLPTDQAFFFKQFGWQGVTPLMGGDYDGDGKTDIGIYAPTSGDWYIELSSSKSVIHRQLGGINKLPLSAGDYDRDGATDIGVYDTITSTWEMLYSTQGFNGTVVKQQFGWRGVVSLGV